MLKINVAEQIKKLIPVIEPESEDVSQQLRYFFMDLLRETPDILMGSDMLNLEFPVWEKSTLSKEQLLAILDDIEQKGMLKDWYVAAYLASLAHTIGTKNEKKAYQWASANAYIILQLVDKNERNIKMLCMRFRLAHPHESEYTWIWGELPYLPNSIASIVEELENLEELFNDTEGQSSSQSSARIAEIRRPYQTKAKIDRIRRQPRKPRKPKKTPPEGNDSTHLGATPSVHTLIQDTCLIEGAVRIPFATDEDSLKLDQHVFPVRNPIKGVSHQEQLHDHKNETIVDTNFETLDGMENSANNQGAALDQQVAHIQRNAFEFPSNPKVFLLPQIQILFAELWANISKVNPYSKHNKNKLYVEFARTQIIDSCILMSLFTASPADIWLDPQMLFDQRQIIRNKSRNDQPFWFPELDITAFKVEMDAKVLTDIQQNKHMKFALPLPHMVLDILTSHSLWKVNLPSKEDIKTRVFELRKELKLTILSPDRILSALHGFLRRYADDHNVADLLCSISPQHSPGLFYGSFDLERIEEAYGNAISQFSKNAEGFDDAYLAPGYKLESCGSQITPRDNLVICFFADFSRLLQSEADPIKQFNLYSWWMWHIFMLLTSCRPVDHMPGMLKQIDRRAKLIWLSDKDGRLTSSSGRFIPLCNFLANALDDYVVYLQSYTKKYGATDAEIDSVLNSILNSDRPLLYIYQNKRWKPLTPKLVLDFVEPFFPFPLNWTRHFGRYYLYKNVVDINLIDAIFGHEAPSHEALHPYSSTSLSELKSVGIMYDQMAEDLLLERVQIHVA